MSTETYQIPCKPQTLRQIRECGGDHAVHRQLTDLALYSCNCGYSSGWRPVEELPPTADFLAQHMVVPGA